jgi:hypothetical protein
VRYFPRRSHRGNHPHARHIERLESAHLLAERQTEPKSREYDGACTLRRIFSASPDPRVSRRQRRSFGI